jgi:hypothetical protein
MPILGMIAAGLINRTGVMGSWATNGNFSGNKSRPTPIALNNTMYFLTGDAGGAGANRDIISGSGNGTWTTTSNAYPYTCLGPWVANVNGTVYVGSGYTGGYNVYTTTNMSTFTSMTNFPTNGLRSCCATSFKDTVYVSGGYADPGGGWSRKSYKWDIVTNNWVAQTDYPLDTDTPSMWTFDNTSKYYWNYGDTYSYTGSGAYTVEIAPPVGLNGTFCNTTVYKGRVYIGQGAGYLWYSWAGSGGWRTEVSSSYTSWGGAILNGTMYFKEDGYNTRVHKSVIG